MLGHRGPDSTGGGTKMASFVIEYVGSEIFEIGQSEKL